MGPVLHTFGSASAAKKNANFSGGEQLKLRAPESTLGKHQGTFEQTSHVAAFTNKQRLLRRHAPLPQKYHGGRTKVMASGLRTKAEALALAGCDFLVVVSVICNNISRFI